jgi:adenine-specific DNA-methyltransferase
MAIKDYGSWDKSRLIEEVRRLSTRKKYGLVWEDKPEDVVERCKTELPVLEEVEERAIENDLSLPTNFIIEGDNYHALSVLNYTHAGQIDAIYADPPYNTGAKNWIYNNDYVDGNDSFRHSKWLCFMERRLRLAKTLLKKDGIIVVTIDDYEIATLTLLMNEIFGEENHLGTVVIKNNPQGRSSVSGFQVSHEYALFYARGQEARISRLARTQEQIDRYGEQDAIGPFEWRNFRAQYSTESPKMKYPIFVKKDCSDFRLPKMKWNQTRQSYDLLEQPDETEIISLPIDPNGRERTWKWSKETVQEVKDTQMGVRLDRDGNPSVYFKGRMKDDGMLPYTIWDKPDYSASTMGANLLASMIGAKKFDYPKSLYAVMDSLRVLTSNKNATILDFFAGSGTTGHAVMELNKEDEGKRRYILCTNNENGIAENVTYERIKKVVSGYADKEGILTNIRYFKTLFVPKSDVSDDTRRSLIEKSTKMLCVKESTFKKVTDNKKFKIYRNQEQATGILFDLDAIDEFKEKLDTTELPTSIYVFSLTSDNFSEDFDDLKIKHRIRPIPEGILEVYRKIFV